MNIPVLMYHEIIDEAQALECDGHVRSMAETYYVKKGAFEAQLSLLRDNGFNSILLGSLTRRIEERDRWDLPQKNVVITFDDGYVGNYTHAFPLLKKYGFQAVFFVATNWIGRAGMMSWQMLEEMSQAGMAIQSHTKTHPFLKQLSDEQVAVELMDSKREIEQRLHKPVRYISLPNGSYGKNYKAIAAAAGYVGGCSSHIGYNSASTDGFLMRRIHISSHYNINDFKKIVLHKGIFVVLQELKQGLFGLARVLMGENLYLDVYRVIFGIRAL